MIEYNILHDLQQHGGTMEYTELLNSQREQWNTPPATSLQLLKHLLSRRCVSGKPEAYHDICLEPAGTALLDQLEDNFSQMAKDRAEKITQQKRERIFSISLTILGELIAFGLGFLTHILLT